MKRVDDSLGCGWNDEAMALALTLEGREPMPRAVQKHVRECAGCAEELRAFRGLEDTMRLAFDRSPVPGDLDAAQAAVREHRKGRGRRLRWWAPGLAFACAIALFWGLVLEPGDRSGVRAPEHVVSAHSLERDPLAGLTDEERIEVETVLAQLSEGEVDPMVGSWESFPEETYWDVAEDIEAQDLDGLEEALDALLEG